MGDIGDAYLYHKNLDQIGRILRDTKEGRKTRVGFLGASVTKGEMVKRGSEFFSVIKKKWCSFFHTPYMPEFKNYSQSGTLSGNALFRLDTVLSDQMDVVFLDFSMNDTGEAYLAEAYEGLVYHLRKNKCEVVILLFCNERGNRTQGAMLKIADHYHVPVLDIGKKIMDCIRDGKMSWAEFALDYVHPNPSGHELIADCILHFFQAAEEAWVRETPFPKFPPEPCFEGMFWDYTIVAGLAFEKTGISWEGEFSILLIEYTQTPEYSNCSYDIFIDGDYVRTIDRFSEFSWDNRVVHPVFEDIENKRHQVQLKPAADAVAVKEDWDLLDVRLCSGKVS